MGVGMRAGVGDIGVCALKDRGGTQVRTGSAFSELLLVCHLHC